MTDSEYTTLEKCLFPIVLRDKIEDFDAYETFVIETQTEIYENIDKLINYKKKLFYPKTINNETINEIKNMSQNIKSKYVKLILNKYEKYKNIRIIIDTNFNYNHIFNILKNIKCLFLCYYLDDTYNSLSHSILNKQLNNLTKIFLTIQQKSDARYYNRQLNMTQKNKNLIFANLNNKINLIKFNYKLEMQSKFYFYYLPSSLTKFYYINAHYGKLEKKTITFPNSVTCILFYQNNFIVPYNAKIIQSQYTLSKFNKNNKNVNLKIFINSKTYDISKKCNKLSPLFENLNIYKTNSNIQIENPINANYKTLIINNSNNSLDYFEFKSENKNIIILSNNFTTTNTFNFEKNVNILCFIQLSNSGNQQQGNLTINNLKNVNYLEFNNISNIHVELLDGTINTLCNTFKHSNNNWNCNFNDQEKYKYDFNDICDITDNSKIIINKTSSTFYDTSINKKIYFDNHNFHNNIGTIKDSITSYFDTKK
jgi:hypothetical protein